MVSPVDNWLKKTSWARDGDRKTAYRTRHKHLNKEMTVASTIKENVNQLIRICVATIDPRQRKYL
jgi:hypothetical protein